MPPYSLRMPHQVAPPDRAVLHRIADEDQLQIEFFGELEEFVRILVAHHRAFIDDDAATGGGGLHLPVDAGSGPACGQ